MKFQRVLSYELIQLSKQYPVVTIVGPRQAGKTTLARQTFSSYNYLNLEHPEIRTLAMQDPNAFFYRFPAPVIIDEIQRVPELLSYIQVAVDQNASVGQYILTGSNQLELSESITQSLAGRTALLKLLPLSIHELDQSGIKLSRDEFLTKGFLPRIYDQDQQPFKAYGNYLETYVQRDLRQQINIRNLAPFETFLKLLAGRVGQEVNLHALSNDIGVSSATLAQWLSILEASFIVFRLYPYYENMGKRLVKSPKIYFIETGLVCYLLGIETSNEVARDPLIGGLFENLVVMDILKTRYHRAMPANLYYYRDNHGNEIDLIFENKRKLIPIEIKSAMTFNESMTRGIHYFQKISKKETEKGFVIYSGDLQWTSDTYEVRNFTNLQGIF